MSDNIWAAVCCRSGHFCIFFDTVMSQSGFSQPLHPCVCLKSSLFANSKSAVVMDHQGNVILTMLK